MATTHKTIVVKGKSKAEVVDTSRYFLQFAGFRTKELPNWMEASRGGFWMAPIRFVLRFSEPEPGIVHVDGEFYILAMYFIQQTVDNNAVNGCFPRRRGYELMQQYIGAIGGNVVKEL